MMLKIINLIIYFVLMLPYFIYGFISVYKGRLTGDEGLYILSAVNILSGKLPYRNFLFTQMPLLPYFYATVMSIAGKSLISARWISFFIGMAAVVFVILSCHKKGGMWGAIIGGSLLTFNRSFIFDVCSVKTQALTVFLTASSIFFITNNDEKDGKILLSICLMNLAVLTRLSILPALIILWAFLLYTRRGEIRRYLAILAANIALLCFMFMFLNSNGNFLYCVYDFHKYGNIRWSLNVFHNFINGWLGNQLCILACFIGALGSFIYYITVRFIKKSESFFAHGDIPCLFFLLTCYVTITLIHAGRAISYPIYQTSNIAFIATFTGIIIGRLIHLSARPYVFLFMIPYLAFLFLSMPYQEYVINWNGDGGPARTQEAARLIKDISKAGDKILSLNAELATESNLKLLPGYEFGEFSYSPDMPDEEAKKLNIVNTARLWLDIEERKADIICLTSRDIVLLGRDHKEELTQLLTRNYGIKYTVFRYGQFFQDLYIMKAKS